MGKLYPVNALEKRIIFSKAPKRCLFNFAIALLISAWLLPGEAFAFTRTWTGASSTLWTDGNNWSGGVAPVANDDVVFTPSSNITVTAVPTITLNSIKVNGTADVTLQAAGVVTVSINNSAAASDLDIQSGSLTMSTNVNITMLGGSNFLVASAATLNIGTSRTFTLTNAASTTASIGGTINVDGALTIGASALMTVNGTINAQTNGAVTASIASLAFSNTGVYNHQRNAGSIPAAAYNTGSTVNITGITTTYPTFPVSTPFSNLNWNCASQTATAGLNTPITISENLTITAGTLIDNGQQITGNAFYNFTMASGAGLTLGTATATTFPTGFLSANITLHDNSTVTYTSTAASQTISDITNYGNLVVAGANTKSLAGNINVDGNLTVNAGILSDNGFTITGTSGKTLTLANTAGVTLQLGNASVATTFPTTFGTYSLGTLSNVIYNSSVAQTISSAPNYGNLTLSGTAVTKTVNGNVLANGTLTINATNTLDDDGFTIDVNGNVTSNGTHTGTGKLLMSGTAAQTLSGNPAAYGNLEFANSHASGVTFSSAGTAQVNGNVTVISGTLFIGSFTTSLVVSGSTSVSGTLTVNNATGTKTFNDLTIQSGGTWNNTANEAITINGNFVNNGTFTSGTGVYTFAGASKTISGSTSPLSISNLTANGTYTNNITVLTVPTALAGAGTLTMGVNTTLNIGGTVTVAGLDATTNTPNTVIYNSIAAAQTVKAVSYYNLTIDKNAQTATVATPGITVNNNLTINTGRLDDGGFQIAGNNSGTMTMGAGTTLTLGLTGGTNNTTFPTLFAAGDIALSATSTVNYNANAAQTISSVPTYGHLTLTATGAFTKTVDGAVTVNGNFTIGVNNTFADAGNTITVKGNLVNNSATGHTGSGEILLTSGSAVHTMSGTGPYTNLELNDAVGASLSNNTTINGNLTITTGTMTAGAVALTVGASSTTSISGTLSKTSGTGALNFGNLVVNAGGTYSNTGNSAVIINGNLQNDGTFTSGTGVYTLAGAAKTISGATSTLSINNITSNGSYTNHVTTLNVVTALAGVGTFTMGSNTTLILSGTATVTNLNATANTPNTVHYNSITAAQTVKGTGYYNLVVTKAAQTATAGTPGVSINNDLTINSGTFANGTFLVTGPGSGAGTFSMNTGTTSAYTITNTSANPFPVFQSYDFHPTASTVNYTGATTAAQTISPLPDYGNLTISGGSGAGNKTAGGALTVNGNLSITTLALADAGNTITVKGNIVNNAGHTGAGKILLTGGSAVHSLTGTGAYSNLELDDSFGANMGASFTINGTLTLTSGTYSVGAFTLTLAGPSVAGTTSNFATTTTSNVTFSGTSTGVVTPSGISNLANLTLSNANGVSLGSNITVNAATGLTLTSGRLSLGNFDFTYNTTSTATGGTLNANNMIVADAALGTGKVKKIFPAATNVTFTFPVGDNSGTAEYSPVTLTTFNSSILRTIGVGVNDAVHAEMNNPNAQTNYVSRYWTFSDDQPGTGAYTYTTLTFSIVNTADLNGTVSTANDQINRWDGSQWNQMSSTITAQTAPTPYTAQTSIAHNQVTGTLHANDFTVRFNNQQTYIWNATSGSGSWTAPTNWTPTRNTPLATDILQFTNGGTVTVTDVPSQTIARLAVNGTTDVTLTSAAATQTLTISNTAGTNFTIGSGSALRLSSSGTSSTVIAFAGTNITNIAGLLELNSNTSNNNTVNFTSLLAANNTITGTVTNNGGIITATTATTAFGAGSIYNHSMNAGTVPAPSWNAASTCNINSPTTGPAAGVNQVFGHLTVNTGSGVTTTMNGAVTVAGNLTVSAGTFFDNGSQITGNASGTLSVAAGATLRINAAFPTNFTTGNISLNSSSTVNYTGAAQSVSATPAYGNLSINVGAGSGVKTALGALNINGNLTVGTGTLFDNGFAINGTAGGTLTLASNGTLQLGNATTATSYPTGFGTHNLGVLTTVNYNSTAAVVQNISGVPVYGNLTTTAAAAARTKTMLGNVTVAGNFTNGNFIVFNLNGFTLDIAGTYSNAGASASMTTNAANSRITLSGTTSITFTIGVYSSPLSNFTVNKTSGGIVTLGSALTLGTGSLQVLSGTLRDGGFQITGNAAGTLSVASGATLQIGAGTATVETFPTNYTKANITLSSGSTVIYNTTGAQPISSVPDYANVTISGASTKTIAAPGPMNVAGNLSITAGTLADGGYQITGNATGTMTMSAATGLTLGTTATATQFPTNFISGNVSIASNGTVTYNSNQAQNVSAVPTYGHLVTVATAAVTKTVQGNITVAGNFTNGANNTFHLNGNSIAITGTYTNSGILRGDIANSGITINGTGALTFTIGTYTNSTLYNFTTNRTGTITLGSSLVIGNTLTLNSALAVAGLTLTLNGPAIGGTPTNLSTTTASSLVFGGSATGVSIPSSVVNLSTLTVNNANGVSMNSSVNLNSATAGALTLTNGALSIGSNTLTLTGGGISYGSGSLTGGTTSNLTLTGGALSFTLNAVSGGLQNLTLTRSAASTLTLGANLTLNGNFTTNANNILADGGRILTIKGNSTHNGSHTGAGKILLNGGSAAHALTGTGPYTNLELDDANGANMGSSFAANGTLTLTNGAFAVNSATYPSVNTLTLNGPAISQTVGTLTTTAVSILNFTGIGTGHFIPSSVSTLGSITVNNTNGVSLTSNVTVNSATGLTLTNGRLTLGNYDLTFATTATTIGGTLSAANMVVTNGTGQLKKSYNASVNTTFTFPVGDVSGSADYSPVVLTNFNTSVVRTLGVNVNDNTHPSNASNGAQTHYVSRYWTFSDNQAGTGTYTYTAMAFTYSTVAPTDVNGTVANYRINRWDGSQWSQLNSTVAAPTVTSSGTYNQTSGTLGGNDFTLRVNPQQSYTWQPTSGTNDFQTATNWSPARYSPQVNDVLLFSNGGASIANNIPAQTIAQLLVSNNTDITLQPATTSTLSIAGSAAATNLSVANGSTLQVGGGGTVLTLSVVTTSGQIVDIAGTFSLNANSAFSGVATTTVNVSGTLNVVASTSTLTTTNTITTVTGTINRTGGTITSAAINLIFDNGSTYNHAMNGGNVPTATYYRTTPTLINNSTVNITGLTTTNLTGGLAGTFSHINWDCSGQTTADGRVNGAITVNGNLQVLSGTLFDNGTVVTGNASGTFSVAAGATYTTSRVATPWLPSLFTSISLSPTSTINYNGATAFTIPANPNGAATTVTTYGHLGILAGGVVKTLGTPITVNNLTVTSGTLANNGHTITTNGNLHLTTTHSGTGKILLSGGSSAHSISGGGTSANLELDDANGANMTGNLIISGALTLTDGTYSVGSSTLTLNGGAILGTETNFATTTGSVLVFGPNTNANAGLYVPSSVSNLAALTVNIAATNTVTLNNSVMLNATGTGLTLTQGRIILGSNDLTFSTVTTLTGGGSTSAMIIADGAGQVKKVIPATTNTTFTFPVGDNSGVAPNNTGADYSPVVLTNFNSSIQRTIGVKVTDDTHIQNGAQTHYVSRIWSISDNQTGNGTYSYTGFSFAYSATANDANGTNTNYKINRWDASQSQWFQLNSTGGASTATTGTYTETSGPIGDFDFALRVNEPSAYTWIPTSGTNDFQAATNWSPPRYAQATNDILQFLNGGTPTANNVPTQTVTVLFVDNGTKITLVGISNNTLTLNDHATLTDLNIQDGKLTIGTNLNITVGAAANLSDAYISAGDSLVIMAGRTFTINGLAGTTTQVDGTIVVDGTLSLPTGSVTTVAGSISNTGAASAITSNGTSLIFDNGSAYNHMRNGGTIPVATYYRTTPTLINNSTVNITGITSAYTTSGLNQVFSNLTWNCPSQTIVTSSLNGAITVNGNLQVLAGTLHDGGNQITGNAGGTFSVASGATFTTARTATSWFPLNTPLGSVTLDDNSTVNFDGNAAFTLANIPSSYGHLSFRVGGTKTLPAATPITVNGSLSITAGALADNGNIITVEGNLTNAGTHSGAGKVLLTNGASGHLISGAGTHGNIELNDALGAALGSNVGIGAANTLTLTNGHVSLGAFNLTLNNTNNTTAIGGSPSATSMIVIDGAGQLVKSFAAGAQAAFTYPVGETTGTAEYTPATITFSANGAAGLVGIRVIDGDHPSLGGVPNYLSRYWRFAVVSGMGSGYTYTASFNYIDPDDVNGTLANINAARWDGANWNPFTSTNGSSTLTITSAPLTNVTAALNNAEFTGRETALTYYFRSITSGNWNSTSTWEASIDGVSFANPISPAPFVPDENNSLGITIRNNHTVTVTVNASADQVTIDNTANSTLTINNGVTFTLKDYTGNDLALNANSRLNVYGTLVNQGQISGSTTTTTRFWDTGVYQHDQNGGTVPTATWNTPSECLISGVTTTAPTGFTGQAFGKLTWNNAGQTGTPLSLGIATVTVNGDFTLVSTGASATNVIAFNTTTSTVNINGDLLVQGGTLSMNNSGGGTLTTLNLAGNYNQTGGTFQRGTSTGVQAFNFNNASVNRTYTQSGGTITTTGIAFTVNAGAIVTLASNIVIPQSFTVTGTLNTGTQTISGTGSFTVTSAATATLGVGSPNGIVTAPTASGNVQTTTRIYNIGANYTYNGSAAQNTGNGLTTCRDLTIDNAADVSLTGAVFINNQLILNNGVLKLGDYDLILNNTASTAVAGNTPTATNMVATNGVGQMTKAFPATAFTSFTYPVGDITGTAEYSPVTLAAPVTNNTARNIGVRVVDARHPNDVVSVTVDYLTRYWAFSCSNTTGLYTLNADFRYIAPDDVNGTEANLNVNQYDPIGTQSWTEFTTTVSSPVLSVTGVTQASNFLLTAFDIMGRKNVPAYYRSLTSGNWNAPSTWEISSDPAFISPAPVPATSYPTASNSNGILIQSAHTVTVTDILLTDDLTVDGALTVNSGISFTVSNGLAATDITVNGVFNMDGIFTINSGSLVTVNGTMNNTANSGSFVTTAATLNFANGSTYDHQRNGGNIITAGWNAGSTCKISSPFVPPSSGINQTFGGLTMATSATVALHGTTTVAGVLTLTSGTLSLGTQRLNLDGTIAAGGTGKLSGTTSSILAIGGSGTGSMGTLGFATGAQTAGTLIMNRTGGASFGLSSPLTITTLTLTNGVVDNSSNLLSLAQGGTFSGASANSYVSGVFSRTIPASNSGVTYVFPIGVGSYNPIEIVSPTTSAGGNAIISAQVFDASSGGSAGAGVATLNTDRYWNINILSGAANLTVRGNVRVTDASASASKVLAQSATQTGTYNYIGATLAGQTLLSSYLLNANYNYFAIGDKGTLCGIYTVGNSGAEDFRNLTDVRNALATFTVSCDVAFELTTNYSSASPAETYPVTFNAFTYGVGGPFDVTVRPANGATPVITGANATAVIDVNGAGRLIFDGRQGGTSNPKSLTISNTNTTGATIRFINDAQNDSLKYCVITGVTTGNSGIVLISTTAATTGNDNIGIENCDLTNGATVPTNIIYSSGTAAKENDNISISNNNIYNFSTSGITVAATGNAGNWNISGNNFYSTVTVATAQTVINFIPGANSQNNSITNNTIGGQAANAGGPAWLNSGAVAFTGIAVSAGTTTATTLDGNVIKSISLSSTGAATFTGINAIAGLLNIGSTTGNNVGDVSTSNSIVVAGTSTTTGINSSSTASVTISKNNVANMHASGTGTGVAIRGIVTSSTGVNTITENVIQKLSTNSTSVGTGASSCVVGISQSATGSGLTIAQNTVHSLSNSAVSAAVVLTGIFNSGSTSGSNRVERNLVHSLSMTSTAVTATTTGIHIAAGNADYQNNMIRMGINAAGAGLTNGYVINGINEAAGTNNFYHNSIYVGGTGVTSSSNTYAFYSAVTTGTRSILNNIFFNARGNGSGAAKNYAMRVGALTGLTSNYNDLYANGSGAVTAANAAVDYATLTAWKLATAQDAASFSIDPAFIAPAANAATVDLHIQTPPAKTPVEAVGVAVGSVTNDWDDDARSANTPVDVGADAGNFDYLDLIPPAIVYTLIPDNNSNDANPYVFSGVQITDFSGVNVTAGTKPRLYYKKSGHANTYVGNTSGDNGWKYVEASNASSPFTFTFDYTILFGGGVAMNDVIQYFVVAQDLSPDQINVGINSGTFNTYPTSVNLASSAFALTSPPAINSFVIKFPFGTVTVGTGGDFTSFTRAGGLFQAINTSTLTGDLTVRVISDITNEDGAHGLNQWTENPSGSNFTVVITPSTTTMRIVSGTYNGASAATAGLFRLNGADRVTVDGRDPVSETGMYLTFRNTNTTVGAFNSTFNLYNDAVGDTIRYCILEGASRGSNSSPGGVVRFSASGGVTGNDNHAVEYCEIRGVSGSGNPAFGIVSAGTNTAGQENSDIVIANNNIYDFYTTSGESGGVYVENGGARGSENWTISDNSFYQTAVVNTSVSLDYTVIHINQTDNTGFVIENNYIGGRAAQCGGLEWTQDGSQNSFIGIFADAVNTSIQGNVIQNINIASEKDQAENAGISVPGGSADIGTVTGNIIGSPDLNTTKGIVFQSSGNTPKLIGISTGTGGNAGEYRIENNTVAGIALPSGSTVTVKNEVTTATLNTNTGTTTTITYTGEYTGTNQPTADGRDKGYYKGTAGGNDDGLTINLSNSNYTSVNAYWGMKINPNPAYVVGNVLGAPGPDPTNPGCLRPGNLVYNSSAGDRANGKAIFTGTTSYRVRTSSSFTNVTMNIRLTVTVTNSGGAPVPLVYDSYNDLINVPFTQALKVNMLMETQTPNSISFLYSTTYPSSGSLSANTWYPSIWLYNKINTDPGYKICTGVDWSLYQPGTTQTGNVIAHTVTTMSNLDNITGTTTTVTYTGQRTGTTTNPALVDGRDKGNYYGSAGGDDGIIMDITNSNYGAIDASWGISTTPGWIVGNDAGAGTNGPCTKPTNLTYDPTTSNLAGGIAMFTGTTIYRALNFQGAGGAMTNISMPVRMRVEVKTPTGTAIPLTLNNNVVTAPFDQPLKVMMIMETRTNNPVGFSYANSSGVPLATINPNTWYPSIFLFDVANNDQNTNICTGWNWDFYINGTTSEVVGILAADGAVSINNNTVNTISSDVVSTLSGNAFGITGISLSSTDTSQTISGNTVFDLEATSSIYPSSVVGIHYDGPVTGTNKVEKNFVHSFSTNADDAVQIGINAAEGVAEFSNNFLRLGIRSDGAAVANSAVITGILDASSDTATGYQFYHNTVYVGGNGVTSDNNSYALRRELTYGSGSNTVDMKNNIFMNDRSTSTGSGKNYGMHLDRADGISSDYNLVYGSGGGYTFGRLTSDYADLAAWSAATSLDTNSVEGDPLFVNATAGTPDLHIDTLTVSVALLQDTGAPCMTLVLTPISAYSPAEGRGMPLPSVGNDYDVESRDVTTPDIGADEFTNCVTGAGVWTAGGGDTDWFNADNWSCKFVPDSTTHVIIPGGKSFYPALYNATPACSTLTILNGGAVTLTGAFDLDVQDSIHVDCSGALSVTDTASYIYLGGNWKNFGDFVHGDGKVVFDGTVSSVVVTNDKDFSRVDVNKAGLGAIVVPTTAQDMKSTLLKIMNGEMVVESLRTVTCTKGDVEVNGKVTINTQAILRVEP